MIMEHVRHSFAHLLAAAVRRLYPKVQFGIGPVIENGFYYDFANVTLVEQDLSRIEKEMRSIASQRLPFAKKLWLKNRAKAYFKKQKQPFKLELIKDLKERKVGMVSTGDLFLDLCRGGHVKNTSELPLDAFKLTRVAGAYWKGDEKRPQLTRIYGVAFSTKDEMEAHLAMLEEAKRRDHRKLGKELKLFTLIDEVGPGLPLFYPKGAIVRRLIEGFVEEQQQKRGYLPIWIPHITKGQLYKISGHLDKYGAMFPAMRLKGEADYYLKPMNCPHFMMLYKAEPHSWRELPLRWTATTTNYRYEKSGELSGITRLRALTQDDCHVFCRSDQIEQEVNLMLDMTSEAYRVFGFKDFWVRISTRDPKRKNKYIGSQGAWKTSEAILTRLIEKRGWKHDIGVGEAAFYGPKLDFIFKDVLSREWQLSTIQLDMNLPQRFDLAYIDEQGKKKQPVLIHRAILGSVERFLGILIEHYAGAFPLWLAPEQVWILPISEKFNDFAQSISSQLKGIRTIVRTENESLGKKIREGELQKIPYLLVVGEKEQQNKTISVRRRGQREVKEMKLEMFLNMATEEVRLRSF
ncbi:MAG: threonine--tRNA ligase [Parcubacteria group bacterium]|nr:threonine--tRNA ligase [Parcubacteria group bacterium]